VAIGFKQNWGRERGSARRPIQLSRWQARILPRVLRGLPFRRLWAAATLSALGDAVSSIALPLTAIMVLDANIAESALLSALVWVPSLVLSVPVGVWVDRSGNRRRVMIWANIGRFVALGSVPFCVAIRALTMSQMYAVMVALGVCSVLTTVSESGIFATVVPADQYVEGQAAMHGGNAAATLSGPALGGVLVYAVTAPVAVLLDAICALFAAFLLLRVRLVETVRSAKRWRDALPSGASFIWHSPLLRTALAVTATVGFFNLMFNGVLLWYFVNHLGLPTSSIGLVFSAQAAGAVLGSTMAPRISLHFGLGRMLLVGCVLFNAPLIVVPTVRDASVSGLAVLVVAAIGSGWGAAIQDVSVGSVFALVVPDEMRSQVRGSFLTVSHGMRPLGALAGAGLGTAIGVQWTMWVGAVGGLLAVAWVLPSPLLALVCPQAPKSPPSPPPTSSPPPCPTR
jgi:MFS family permease